MNPSAEDEIAQILAYLFRKPFPEPHHSEVSSMILRLCELWDGNCDLRPGDIPGFPASNMGHIRLLD